MRLLDSNVLLYSISGDPKESEKTEIAVAILQSSDLALSVQVLQEFYVQATRTTRPHRLVRAAIDSSQRFQISYWDAAIIEASRALGCKEVLSEDLKAGQSYGGVRVVNPFAAKRPKANGKK